MMAPFGRLRLASLPRLALLVIANSTRTNEIANEAL